MKNKTNMKGRTLFETIAAMAVISLMAAGIYKLTNSIMDRYKMSRINNQIYALQKVVNERFMVEGNYDMRARHGERTILKVLQDENLLDSDMRKGKHAFGGKITIDGVIIQGQDNEDDPNIYEASRYFIRFEPGSADSDTWTEVCMSFGDMNWLSEGGSSLVKQCYGSGCEVKKNGKDKNLEPEIGNNCACTYKIPADEATLEKCSGNAKILWIFE